MRWTGRRGAESRSTRLSAVWLVLVVGLLPRTSYGQEKTQLFIDEVRFKGTPSSMEEQVPLWGSALAAEVSGILRDLETHTPMTLQTLESQLGKERRKAALECADASCINRLVENFGISESVFGVVTWLGPTKIQVTLVQTAGDEKLGEAAPRYAAPEYDAIAQALRTMTGELFGVSAPPVQGHGDTPGEQGRFQERDFGTAATKWDIDHAEKAVVRLESIPSGAVVLVDGLILCAETPCTKLIALGSHRFEMQKEEYVPKLETLEISKDANTVSMSMTPDFGTVVLTTEPAGLPAFMDGQEIGETPLQKERVPSGAHTILVKAPQFFEKGRDFILERGEVEMINFTVEPRLGGIEVIAVDNRGNVLTEAKVFIDEMEVGLAPFKAKVLIGAHRIKVTYDSVLWTKDVIIREETMEYVGANIDLARAEKEREEERKRQAELARVAARERQKELEAETAEARKAAKKYQRRQEKRERQQRRKAERILRAPNLEQTTGLYLDVWMYIPTAIRVFFPLQHGASYTTMEVPAARFAYDLDNFSIRILMLSLWMQYGQQSFWNRKGKREAMWNYAVAARIPGIEYHTTRSKLGWEWFVGAEFLFGHHWEQYLDDKKLILGHEKEYQDWYMSATPRGAGMFYGAVFDTGVRYVWTASNAKGKEKDPAKMVTIALDGQYDTWLGMSLGVRLGYGTFPF